MIAAEQLRWPFFVIAAVVLLAAVGLEAGSTFFLTTPQAGAASATQHQLGIPSLWLLDIALLWSIALTGASVVVNKNLVARLQGICTLVLSIIVIFAALKTAIEAFVLIMVMLALIASFFGIIVYLAIWGSFDTSSADVVLGAITFFKLAFAVLLVLAQQRFLQSKGLVLLIVLSLVCDLLLDLLHGIVPGVLVSLTDAVGALIIAIVAIVYAIFQAVWAIVAIVRAIV
jgi:hypothetical protein